MNRIMTTLAIIAVSATLTLQGGEVSDRHQGAHGRQHSGAQHRPASRPSARPSSGNPRTGKEKARPAHESRQQRPQQRPDASSGDRHDRKHGGNRHPSGQQPGLRPGAGGNHGQGGHNRPSPPTARPQRPHHSGGPGYGDHRPGGRPGQRPTPPPRPYYGHVPRPHRPWSRPLPPPRWRPRRGVPTVGTILGLTIGTAFNATLNYLAANNYTLTGYTPEEIVLASVPMYGYTWPTARLLYNNGLLYGSQYVYPTAYYDNTRYNMLYNRFCNTYGMPVTVNNTASGFSSTWFGANGGFITLSLEPVADQYGRVIYYTAVTMGN